MLDKIMIEFIKVKHRITYIIDSNCNWITTTKNNEVYVEREFGIEEDSDFSVNGEEIQQFWRDLINVQLVNVNDFVRQEERNAFLISLFAELPCVEVTKINGENAIAFKEGFGGNRKAALWKKDQSSPGWREWM